MFHDIPVGIRDRMRLLEEQDARDHASLQQVPKHTGRMLALLAASAPPGTWIEVGTSGGYSSLWLALAARSVKGVRHVTFEVSDSKIALARETFAQAGVDGVEIVHGDAVEYLHRYTDVAFCFIDAVPRSTNIRAYDILVPKLLPGGWLVMDNVVSHRHQPEVQAFLKRARSDKRVDATLLRSGKGQLLCRRNH